MCTTSERLTDEERINQIRADRHLQRRSASAQNNARSATHKSTDQPESHQGGPDQGHDPLNLFFRSPSIKKQADWNGDGAGNHRRETPLWLVRLARVLFLDALGHYAEHHKPCIMNQRAIRVKRRMAGAMSYLRTCPSLCPDMRDLKCPAPNDSPGCIPR